MSYAIFTRANGSRFAYVDAFGKQAHLVEVPKALKKSPAELMNAAADSAGDYVDLPSHVAEEIATASGVQYASVDIHE